MMQTCTGWILDVYIENNEAVLWIKTEEGKAIKLVDVYEPSFYIEPKSEENCSQIIQILSDLTLVSEVKWQNKFTNFNAASQNLICVAAPTINHYNLLLKVLQHEKLRERIHKTYNNRLSHIQRYLFTRLKIEPTSKFSLNLKTII